MPTACSGEDPSDPYTIYDVHFGFFGIYVNHMRCNKPGCAKKFRITQSAALTICSIRKRSISPGLENPIGLGVTSLLKLSHDQLHLHLRSM